MRTRRNPFRVEMIPVLKNHEIRISLLERSLSQLIQALLSPSKGPADPGVVEAVATEEPAQPAEGHV